MGLHTGARKTVGRGAKNHFVKFSSRRWRHPPEPRSPDPPDRPVVQQRNAANARERARMQVLSSAFHRLKACLPWVPRDTKLSKLDTLRLAASYIAHLIRILQEEVDQPHVEAGIGAPHPVALTWPFMINSRSDFPSQDPCRLTATDENRTLVPCEYQNFHCDAVHFVQQ